MAAEPGRNWVDIPLAPDTRYHYRVALDGKPIGEGDLRTWPDQADRVCFFVIGDYGTGDPGQAGIAKAMAARIAEQEKAGNPVRFVLTTGDNIYGKRALFWRSKTGDSDADWEPRFFAPYAEILRSVPFYPTVGNHDGSESEHEGDLKVYLDNFFFPGQAQAGGRYYRFAYGNLAEFFALDTSKNAPALGIGPGSAQFRWTEEGLKASTARWKIPYYHHPRYCGGPTHGSRKDLGGLVGLVENHGVAVIFNGHEHNWQPIEQRTAAGRSLYHVITGAGGELRDGRPTKKLDADPNKAKVFEWAPQRHFSLVVIEGPRMTITPIGADNQRINTQDLVVTLP